jgi:predicted amidohydrolase YtcJ
MRAAWLVAALSSGAIAALSAQDPAVPAASAAKPDLVLVGGKVFTADPARPWAEALAITGERIALVGSTAEVRAAAGPGTRVVELKGRVVVPGFNDAHAHVGTEMGEPIELSLGSSDPPLSDVLRVLAAQVAKAPAGAWLAGEIGGRVLDDPAATRQTLDRVAPGHPVFLAVWTGHAALLNTAALHALGVPDEPPDPPNGWFERTRGTRQLSGIVQEYAWARLERRLHELVPRASRLAGIRSYVQQALRLGITSMQDMSAVGPAPELAAELREAGAPLRWRVMRMSVEPPTGDDSVEGSGYDEGDGVRVWGRKWMLDGTPIERSAAMRQPYADRPAWTGRLTLPPEEIRAALARAGRDREQVLFHVVGEVAPDLALSAMEASGGAEVWRPLRPRFEHADGLTPDLVARVARLGVVVVANPAHTTLRETFQARFGSERLATFQPMRSLLAAGVPLALGSDGPPSPFLNILFASTHPANPREALTREEAVTAYTRGSAFAEFKEAEKGTLAPGLLADLAVVSQDIFTVEAGRLPETAAVLTVIGGRVVYDAATAPPERSTR